MRKIIRVFDIVLAVLCSAVMAFVAAGEKIVPDDIIRYASDSPKINSFYSYSFGESTANVNYQNGSNTETVRLLGVFPVKNIRVTAKETKTVYVSGEAFGIKLYTDGVIVVGTQAVETKSGKKINPAEETGIEVGDIIVSVNNTKVYSSAEVTEIFNDNNGKPYSIRLKRDGRYKTFTLKPEYSFREGCYKAGMWVRDSSAGIGTITFFNPDNGVFASLGHQINDVDTNEIMPLLKGEAVHTKVTGVQKAKGDEAGSLVCDFENSIVGTLSRNTPCGLYGKYSEMPDNIRAYKVASKQEIKKGKAQILSTVEGTEPKLYDIEILRISYTKGDSGKDIVFRVTDSELLEKTGGIVQGMSGSPIIQNGKLAGAVTHVIINSPEKGYAIFASTMFEETYKK